MSLRQCRFRLHSRRVSFLTSLTSGFLSGGFRAAPRENVSGGWYDINAHLRSANLGVEVRVMALLDCRRCGGQILERKGSDNVCLQCGRYPEPTRLDEVWSRWSAMALAERESAVRDGPTARQGAMETAKAMIRQGKSRTHILKATGLSVSDLGRVRRSVVRTMDQSPLL